MGLKVFVRGGGDLASGVIARLHRAGWQVLVAEIQQPLAVRLPVSFAAAIYSGRSQVEEIQAIRVKSVEQAFVELGRRTVPVIVDPEAQSIEGFRPDVVVDARMCKASTTTDSLRTWLLVGLGPGFRVGENCDVVIETKRGHSLGRVIWQGTAEADTGVPEAVGNYESERVLRSPLDGMVHSLREIGSLVQANDEIANVAGTPIITPFKGVVRGLIHDGVEVKSGWKIGDIDPRGDPDICFQISDKALAIGGGVLEAILSTERLRSKLYG